jgi:hypothetical protein
MRARKRRKGTLVLTGNRHAGRIEVRWNGKTHWLRCSSLELLVKLVVAQMDSETGYHKAEASAIYRLRADLDSKELIETGMSGQYRLLTRRAEMRTRIELTPCFFELIDLNLVSQRDADRLSTMVRGAKPR